MRAVGEQVQGLAEGDLVVATMGAGPTPSWSACPPARSTRCPTGMTAEVAAGIPIEFGTADDCLFEFGHLQAGETVLVQAGASGVGLAAVQLAKAAGATVIATASTTAG